MGSCQSCFECCCPCCCRPRELPDRCEQQPLCKDGTTGANQIKQQDKTQDRDALISTADRTYPESKGHQEFGEGMARSATNNNAFPWNSLVGEPNKSQFQAKRSSLKDQEWTAPVISQPTRQDPLAPPPAYKSPIETAKGLQTNHDFYREFRTPTADATRNFHGSSRLPPLPPKSQTNRNSSNSLDNRSPPDPPRSPHLYESQDWATARTPSQPTRNYSHSMENRPTFDPARQRQQANQDPFLSQEHRPSPPGDRVPPPREASRSLDKRPTVQANHRFGTESNLPSYSSSPSSSGIQHSSSFVIREPLQDQTMLTTTVEPVKMSPARLTKKRPLEEESGQDRKVEPANIGASSFTSSLTGPRRAAAVDSVKVQVNRALGPALAISVGTINSCVAYWSDGIAALLDDGSGSSLIKTCLRVDSQTSMATCFGKAALMKSTAAKSKELVLWPKRSGFDDRLAPFIDHLIHLPPQFSERQGKINVDSCAGATLLFCIPSAPEHCANYGDCRCRQVGCDCPKNFLARWRECLSDAATKLDFKARFIADSTAAMLHAMCYDFRTAERYYKKYLVIVAGAGFTSWGVNVKVGNHGLMMENQGSMRFGTYDMCRWLERMIWRGVKSPLDFEALEGKGDKAQYFVNCDKLLHRLLELNDEDLSSGEFTDTLANVTGVDEFAELVMKLPHARFAQTWDIKMEEVFSQIKRACEGSDYTRILCCGKPATTKYYQQWMMRVFDKQVEIVPEPTAGCALGAAYAIHVSNDNLFQDDLFL